MISSRKGSRASSIPLQRARKYKPRTNSVSVETKYFLNLKLKFFGENNF